MAGSLASQDIVEVPRRGYVLVGLQSVVGWERRGVVTGSNMFARQLGQAIGAAFFGSIINATLTGWLRQAPPAIAQQLPATLNVTSQVLGGATRLSTAAAAYMRRGIYLGTHESSSRSPSSPSPASACCCLPSRAFTPLEFAAEEHAAHHGEEAPVRA